MKYGKPERPCMKKQVKGWLDAARDDFMQFFFKGKKAVL